MPTDDHAAETLQQLASELKAGMGFHFTSSQPSFQDEAVAACHKGAAALLSQGRGIAPETTTEDGAGLAAVDSDTTVVPAPELSHADFACSARGNYAPVQECEWPVCGCDPYATRVIEALGDDGLLGRKLVEYRAQHHVDCATTRPRVIKRGVVEIDPCTCGLATLIGCAPVANERSESSGSASERSAKEETINLASDPSGAEPEPRPIRERIVQAGEVAIALLRATDEPYEDEDLIAAAREALLIAKEWLREAGYFNACVVLDGLQQDLTDGARADEREAYMQHLRESTDALKERLNRSKPTAEDFSQAVSAPATDLPREGGAEEQTDKKDNGAALLPVDPPAPPASTETLPNDVTIDRLRSRVMGWSKDVCDQFYNPRGGGQCSTCGHLRTDHEPAKRLREDVDALIAAVRAEARRRPGTVSERMMSN